MSSTSLKRILWLDSARGIALIAMAIYHFTWDLDLFGYIPQGTANMGGWRIFARCIAASFLIIVGISLTLAHANSINTLRYLKRTAIIALAALVITLATWFAMPEGLIFFGILHHIALASVLGLLCLRLPNVIVVLMAAGILVVGQTVNLAAFDPRWLAWTGLFENPPRSNDFVPLVPWFAAVLIGIVAGRFILRFTAPLSGGPAPLQWLGRHSLAFYLIHQPVLIGLIYLFSLVSPPTPQAVELGPEMIGACEVQCLATADENFCTPYCQCAYELAAQSQILANPQAPQTQIEMEMSGIALICERETFETQEEIRTPPATPQGG